MKRSLTRSWTRLLSDQISAGIQRPDGGAPAQYVFMDLTSYEETRLPREDSWARWLKEGAEVALVRWGERVISVDSPKNVDLAVVECDPGVKGNTAQGGLCRAPLPRHPACSGRSSMRSPSHVHLSMPF